MRNFFNIQLKTAMDATKTLFQLPLRCIFRLWRDVRINNVENSVYEKFN